MLVRTYATMLDQYRGQTLTWLDPVARKKDDEIVIPVQIEHRGGPPAGRPASRMLMHGNGTDWKVFDVAVDGVSIVIELPLVVPLPRSRSHGIDGLIDESGGQKREDGLTSPSNRQGARPGFRRRAPGQPGPAPFAPECRPA